MATPTELVMIKTAFEAATRRTTEAKNSKTREMSTGIRKEIWNRTTVPSLEEVKVGDCCPSGLAVCEKLMEKVDPLNRR